MKVHTCVSLFLGGMHCIAGLTPDSISLHACIICYPHNRHPLTVADTSRITLYLPLNKVITLHYIALLITPLHYTTLHYSSPHYITLHCTTHHPLFSFHQHNLPTYSRVILSIHFLLISSPLFFPFLSIPPEATSIPLNSRTFPSLSFVLFRSTGGAY